MQIEVGKFYQTAAGEKVRIYATDGEGQYGIHGAILTDTGWEASRWSVNGESFYMADENIVSEWEENKYFTTIESNSINQENFIPKTCIVPAGTYFLNWGHNYIQVTSICYYPPNIWEDLIAENTNWVKVGSEGYFEGTSMEDVRFIPISAICNCGGRIDTHKPDCPENKAEEEIQQDLTPFHELDMSPQRYLGMYNYKKCECGSESVGGKKHSAWCPKYE